MEPWVWSRWFFVFQIMTNTDSPTNLDSLRHSCAHLLAAAVGELWPEALPTLGPSIETGFYYDFDFGSTKLTDDDLPKIENKMHSIVKTWETFSRKEVTLAEAQELFNKNPYKLELVSEITAKKESLSVYTSGTFTDLCRGGHIEKPASVLQHFKLLSIAGAYWRGNEKNKMLTRVYGTCFHSSDQLNEYLHFLEESKRRDHRKLGKDLEIFTFADEIGPGLPLWLPNGTIIKDELENWGKETEKKWGYQRVSTPFLTKRALFELSGHVPYFEEEMYKVEIPGENKQEQYFIKPMNCPFHHMIFKSRTRSYKELPLKIAEYGTVARYENTGALNGILRPRLFCQNDAHVYCTENQAVDVFVEIIKLHQYYYDTLGLKDYYIVLALRDPQNKDKYHHDENLWEKSEQLSRLAMDKAGIKYVVQNEGAAHYGPKMDFKIKSAIGTEYGISTNQIDLFMPQRFNLKYTDNDGKEKFVVVQHRAPLGSSERFVGFLLEHFAGALPTWLSPVQTSILPISDKQIEYAKTINLQLSEKNIRTGLNDKNEPLSAKIRDSEIKKIPYTIIVGEKEVTNQNITIRKRGQKDQITCSIPEFIDRIISEIATKAIS